MLKSFQSVIDFWFVEIDPKKWWVKDGSFDRLIRERFGALNSAAVHGELFDWRRTPRGRLAEIIVLDQFSRNIFREMPESYESDPMSLALSQEAIRAGDDKALEPGQRLFLYMPFMHSESRLIHEEAVKLFTSLGRPKNLEFELRHKEIIDRFGRYPHRNEILGRHSTAEEIEFLNQPGSSF